MARLLVILSLILSIVLFPPTVLALISNNAVLGDATYPVKRGLENVIFSIASVHSVTKAWFAAARSDRRFEELNILVTKGKQVDRTLDELVEQTQLAAKQIAEISDNTQKAQLVEKLSESIKKYDKGLEQLSQQPTPTSKPVVQPTEQPTSQPAVPSPAPSATGAPIIHPTSKPTTSVPTTIPQLTPTPQLSPSPLPTPISTPTPSPSTSKCDEIEDRIERARCELGRIKVGLGAQSQDAPRQENRGDGKDENGGIREDQKDGDKQNRQDLQKSDEKQGNKDNREDSNKGSSRKR